MPGPPQLPRPPQPPELQALADALAASGVPTVPGWPIALPSIVAAPDQHGDGYLITQHSTGDDHDQPAFWGPGGVRLGRADQVHEVAGIIRRDLAARPPPVCR
jgi:hypothetical protein